MVDGATYNDSLLGRLDGETIGLDRGTGAGEIGFLVLALNLGRSASGHRVGSTAAAVKVAKLVQEDKRTFIFLETAIVGLGCSGRVGLDWRSGCRQGVVWRWCRVGSGVKGEGRKYEEFNDT